MRVERGNIWTKYDEGSPICITTNGIVRRDGCAVMGRGVAWEAAQRFPYIQRELGEQLQRIGNHVSYFSQYHLFTFPVKHHWQQPAELALIERSVGEIMGSPFVHRTVYLPKPGCGNGLLKWESVEPVVAKLDDRFVILDYGDGDGDGG